jgi:hypothetical protein
VNQHRIGGSSPLIEVCAAWALSSGVVRRCLSSSWRAPWRRKPMGMDTRGGIGCEVVCRYIAATPAATRDPQHTPIDQRRRRNSAREEAGIHHKTKGETRQWQEKKKDGPDGQSNIEPTHLAGALNNKHCQRNATETTRGEVGTIPAQGAPRLEQS